MSSTEYRKTPLSLKLKSTKSYHIKDFLYCRVDSITGIPSFGENNTCIRFIGVKLNQFNIESFRNGVDTYTIEINDTYLKNELRTHLFCEESDDCPTCFKNQSTWFKITFTQSQVANSFYFITFPESTPEAETIEILEIRRVRGFTPSDFDKFSFSYNIRKYDNYIFSSFEVGQGMCSLAYNNHNGFLFDCGAGTPINKTKYKSNGFRNELNNIISGKNITFILSHGDGDHWRILNWDHKLRNNINLYLVPSNMKSIAFFDKAVKSKVQTISRHRQINLGNKTTIDIYRSKPIKKTSNNDGLISIFRKDKLLALLPGDCVYSEIMNDSNPTTAKIVSMSYFAIIVPHHGDQKSQYNIPTPYADAKAFFAAGNHATYNHPTTQSLTAHSSKNFINIVNKNPNSIKENILIK